MKTARATRDDYLQWVKAFPLVPIKTERHFDEALVVVKKLAMRGEDHLTVGERDYLAALTFFVEDYENKHYQIDAKEMEPVEALKYLMEESGMTTADLGRLLGNSSVASQILHGKRALSKSHIAALAKRFHVEAGLFIGG
jgi:HTH-type transcriptional regulator/antitoxin HigA